MDCHYSRSCSIRPVLPIHSGQCQDQQKVHFEWSPPTVSTDVDVEHRGWLEIMECHCWHQRRDNGNGSLQPRALGKATGKGLYMTLQKRERLTPHLLTNSKHRRYQGSYIWPFILHPQQVRARMILGERWDYLEWSWRGEHHHLGYHPFKVSNPAGRWPSKGNIGGRRWRYLDLPFLDDYDYPVRLKNYNQEEPLTHPEGRNLFASLVIFLMGASRLTIIGKTWRFFFLGNSNNGLSGGDFGN